MNKSYRSVWSEALGAWVAVAEHASARGKRKSAQVAAAILAVGLGVLTPQLASAQFAIGGSTSSASDCTTATGTGAVAVGGGGDPAENCAVADGVHAIAIGSGAQATNDYALAMGSDALASEFGAVAIGLAAEAQGAGAIAIGLDAVATGIYSTALGAASQASGEVSLAVGYSATASAPNAIALGRDADASGIGAIALGVGANASGTRAIAIGDIAQASGENGISLGQYAGSGSSSLNGNQIAIGFYAGILSTGDLNIGVGTSSGSEVTGSENIGIGTWSGVGVQGDSNVAVGSYAGDLVVGDSNIALGWFSGASTVGSRNIALGQLAGANIEASDTVSLGTSAVASGEASIAVGRESAAAGTFAIAIGMTSQALGDASIAIGQGAIATGSVAVGMEALAGNGGAAFGDGAVATYFGGNTVLNTPAGTAMGLGASADVAGATALGAYTTVTVQSGVAIGAGSRADVAGGAAGYNPTGADAAHVTAIQATNSTALGAVSVGTGGPGGNRQIVNVAAGTHDSDAVNVAQLKAVDEVANRGWNIQADGDAATQVAPGDTVEFISGDNVEITRNGHEITVATAQDVSFATVSVGGNTLINGTGITTNSLSVSGTTTLNGDAFYNGPVTQNNHLVTKQYVDSSVTALGDTPLTFEGDDGSTDRTSGETLRIVGDGNNLSTEVTDGTVTIRLSDTPTFSSVTTGDTVMDHSGVRVGAAVNLGSTGLQIVGGPSITLSGIDAGERTITNVAPGVNGTDAVNMDQLNAVSDMAGMGWNMTTSASGTGQVQGSSVAQVSPGGTVTMTAGDNIVITQDGTSLTIATNPDLQADSLTIAGGPVIDGNGITLQAGNTLDMGGNKITNVAAGTDANDAVNVSQLQASVDGARARYYSVNDGGVQGGNYHNDGATGVNSMAAGVGAATSVEDGVAMGHGAQANAQAGDVALGAGSTTAAVVNTTSATVNGLTFNGFAGTGATSTVSIGSVGAERTLTNVAAGRISATSTDAVNGSQLFATQVVVGNVAQSVTSLFSEQATLNPDGTINASFQYGGQSYTSVQQVFNAIQGNGGGGGNPGVPDPGALQYDRNGDGSINHGSVTLAGENGTTIRNVAPGVAGTDAVNVNQLNQAVQGVNNRINQVSRDASAGTASAMALASMPQAFMPGKSMLSAGAAVYGGQTAIAIGGSRLSDNGRTVVKFSATANSRGRFGVGVGAGFHW